MYQITKAIKKIASLQSKIIAVQGGTCFCSGTKILLSDGSYKNIEDITKHDNVLSYSSNHAIIESNVTDMWENAANKPIISFRVNNEVIRASYDHKFYTTEGYKELYKIIWGDLEESQRVYFKLLCEQYGQDIDVDTPWREEPSNNEACCDNIRQKNKAIQDIKNRNEQEDCCCSQGCSSNIHTEPNQLASGGPHKRKHNGQQGGKSGVGNTRGKHQKGVQERSDKKKVWGSESQVKTNGQSGDRDTERVGYNTQEKSQTTSNRLWGIGGEHKGCSRAQNLLPFTAKQIQIQKPEKTFAISTTQGNYFVGESNINVSNSAGKTFAILTVLIDKAQRDKKPTLTSVVSESIPHLKRGAMRDFKNIMQEHGYWSDDQWNATDSAYTFETGSKIEFFSSDKGDKLRGARRDRCFINEANNVALDAFDQLEVRTREVVYLDWNPTNEFWFYTDVQPYRDDCEHIIVTYKDNEGLDDEIVKAIESRKGNKNWWKVYGEGQLGEVDGKIYTDWDIIDEIPHEARLERYGLDFGYSNDPSAIVAIYYYNGGYILDEIEYRKGLSNKQIADIINNQKQAIVVADSAEPKSIDEIKSYGVSIIPCQKGKDSVNNGIQFVQQQRISMTKRSLNIIKEYRNYLWQTDKDGKILNKPEHTFSHSMDAIRYGFDGISPEKTIMQQLLLQQQKARIHKNRMSKKPMR